VGARRRTLAANSARREQPRLAELITPTSVAVAYLESVKLQFDLRPVALRSARATVLQTQMPREVYRFSAARLSRAHARAALPRARLRHRHPEMSSICACST